MSNLPPRRRGQIVLDGGRFSFLLVVSGMSGLTAAAYVVDALVAPALTVEAVRRNALLLATSAVVSAIGAFIVTGAILARLLGRRVEP